jgi:predicted N-acetyltransferase YhbS
MDPISCYIASKDKRIVGFACYNATAKGVFGPLGVAEEERGRGVGEALLRSCMISMREIGYAYAVIGWTDAVKFYEKAVGATVIENTPPETTIYQNLIHM